MASRYLLDTNILSDLIKNPQGNVAAKIAGLPREEREGIATSIIIAGELRYGASKKGSAILAQRVDQLLDSLDVLPVDGDVDLEYGRLRADLEKRGNMIGANDLWIAAHALAINAVFVTDNVSEFERATGLRVENWLRASK